MSERKAVVLCSGGLDSTTVMAMVRSGGYEIYSLSFRYGQRHAHELAAAEQVSREMGAARHLVLPIDLRSIGGSALTDLIDVPKARSEPEIATQIPVTYVPARNILFLSYGLAWAEVVSASEIFIGVNAVDYSGYPDCRPDFIRAFERMAGLGTRAGVEGRPIRIRTPLMEMTKAQIIRKGLSLGVDYSMTHSCYDPSADGRACGACDSCLLRRKGFREAGAADPTIYDRATGR